MTAARVLVTGATGVVGRLAIPHLLARGHRVTAVGRTPEKRAELTALLQTLLASLDGESNWLTNSERVYKAGEAAGGLVAVAVVVLLFWRLSKRPGGPAAGAPATRG